ncbi:MAG: UDP-N-acetylmuramoyl-L-alanyl-D-glutamate--2,6-diaminopimelate ligase [Defluviitaleaceae bacterium]|nr:UDP-N-acetylmuramoyl-L-alanyl-D-glutamate--2,6-diaminopimelate ligase [Defluviitaleaceae bacterium]
MLLKELLRGLSYEWLQGRNADIDDIVIDSRKAGFGSLFICTRGANLDSHRFIPDAAMNGAAAFVVEAAPEVMPEGAAVVKVENSRAAMAVIAANFYGNPSDDFNLIGVTGTNGKTSVAYFIETILQEFSHKAGLIGTVETRVGPKRIDVKFATATTPDPIELERIFSAMKDEKVNDAVMEVSSHALALDKMEGLRFGIGVFTNLTQDHLDFHGTMENYARAKARLFKMCKYGVINADDDAFKAITENASCEVTTFGIEKDCDIKARDIQYLDEGVSFTVNIYGAGEPFFVPVKGRFTVYNALAAIGAAYVMNIPADVIRRGLKRIKGVPGRIQNVPNKQGFHVIVDYAHTPDALVNIISSVREFTKGELITLFGCGGHKDTTKRPVMGKVVGELSDYCIITSDNPRDEDPDEIIRQAETGVTETNCPYEKITNRAEAIRRGISMLKPGDGLIIAGKGHEDYQEINGRREHFDDVEQAREALTEIFGDQN